MTGASKTVSKRLESKMFDAFVFFLKMTQQNLTISAGAVCNDKAKFSLVCYTSFKLTEALVNSITYFLNNNLKNNDFKREWSNFTIEMIEVSRIRNVNCYIFRTKGGKNNLAEKTAAIHFFPNDSRLYEGNFNNVLFPKLTLKG